MRVKIGRDEKGKAFYYDTNKYPTLLVTGSVGSGKTYLLTKIINRLKNKYCSAELKFLLVDTKNCEYGFMEKSKKLALPIANTDDDYKNLMQILLTTQKARISLFKQCGVRNIEEYNKQNIAKLQEKILIIDEFADLSNEENQSLLLNLTTMARCTGIYIIISTYCTKIDNPRVINGNLKANFLNRICFNVKTKEESKLVIDKEGAEMLDFDSREIIVSEPSGCTKVILDK